MTQEERAAMAVQEWHARNYWAYDPGQHAQLQADISRAIADAVAAERERIARMVEGFDATDADGEFVSPGLAVFDDRCECYRVRPAALAKAIREGQ